jgi:hypothetical protein
MTSASLIDLDQAGARRLIHPEARLDPGNDLETADS